MVTKGFASEVGEIVSGMGRLTGLAMVVVSTLHPPRTVILSVEVEDGTVRPLRPLCDRQKHAHVVLAVPCDGFLADPQYLLIVRDVVRTAFCACPLPPRLIHHRYHLPVRDDAVGSRLDPYRCPPLSSARPSPASRHRRRSRRRSLAPLCPVSTSTSPGICCTA